MSTAADLAVEREVLLVALIAQAYALADDLDYTHSAEEMAQFTGEPGVHDGGRIEAPEKMAHLKNVTAAVESWAREEFPSLDLSGLRGAKSPEELRTVCAGLLARQREGFTADEVVGSLLEAVTASDWPPGLHWVLNREESLAEAIQHLDPDVTTEQVEHLASAYARTYKRMKKDSASLLQQGGRAALTLTLAGVASGAEDNFLQWLGSDGGSLNGAAAQNHGLAALGGGSIASGGGGMAVGSWVLFGIMNVTEAGARRGLVWSATKIGRVAPDALISELAKWDVRQQMSPDLLPAVLESFEKIHSHLTSEWELVRPDPAQRRSMMFRHIQSAINDPSRIGDAISGIRAEVPPEEERNLARSVRALEYEIRHLTSPEWQNHVAKLPRWFGVPVATKMLDRVYDELEVD